MNDTQKLQVATDALGPALGALSRSEPMPSIAFSKDERNKQHGDAMRTIVNALAILAAPGTEQPTGDAVLYVRQIDLDQNKGSLIASTNADGAWEIPLYFAAAQAAPAGDAVAAIVDRAIPPMSARVIDHDISGRPIYSNDPFIGAERAATQPAEEGALGSPVLLWLDTCAKSGIASVAQAAHALIDHYQGATPSGSTEQPAVASIGVITGFITLMEATCWNYVENYVNGGSEEKQEQRDKAKEHLIAFIDKWGAKQREAGAEAGMEFAKNYKKERDDLRARLDSANLEIKRQTEWKEQWRGIAEELVRKWHPSAPFGLPADLAGLTRWAVTGAKDGNGKILSIGFLEAGYGQFVQFADVQAMLAGKVAP